MYSMYQFAVTCRGIHLGCVCELGHNLLAQMSGMLPKFQTLKPNCEECNKTALIVCVSLFCCILTLLALNVIRPRTESLLGHLIRCGVCRVKPS